MALPDNHGNRGLPFQMARDDFLTAAQDGLRLLEPYMKDFEKVNYLRGEQAPSKRKKNQTLTLWSAQTSTFMARSKATGKTTNAKEADF